MQYQITSPDSTNLSTADSLLSALSQYLECSQALFEYPSVERLHPSFACFERFIKAYESFRSVQLFRFGQVLNRLEGQWGEA